MSGAVVIERVRQTHGIVLGELPVGAAVTLDNLPTVGDALVLNVGGIGIGHRIPESRIAGHDAGLSAVFGYITVRAVLRVVIHVLIAIVLSIVLRAAAHAH